MRQVWTMKTLPRLFPDRGVMLDDTLASPAYSNNSGSLSEAVFRACANNMGSAIIVAGADDGAPRQGDLVAKSPIVACVILPPEIYVAACEQLKSLRELEAHRREQIEELHRKIAALEKVAAIPVDPKTGEPMRDSDGNPMAVVRPIVDGKIVGGKLEYGPALDLDVDETFSEAAEDAAQE